MSPTVGRPPLERLEPAPTALRRRSHGVRSYLDFDRHESTELRADSFDVLAGRLESRADFLIAAILRRLHEKRSSPLAIDALELIEEFIGESLRAQLRAFNQGVLPERCPEVDAAAVRTLARNAELELLLLGYRSAQMVLWQTWFGLVEDSQHLRSGERRDLLSRGSDYFFRYADLLSDYAAEAYRRQVEQFLGNSEQRRFRAVKELLDGDELAGSWLDFRLDRHHLGLIVWGQEPLVVARQLSRELGRPLFSVSPPESGPSCWVWLSGDRSLDADQQDRLKAFAPAAPGIALGLEAFGPAGFCATHRQARRARSFACEGGPTALRYENVVVEALASENEDEARAFVAHELRGIADDSLTSSRLRQTLAAYFASEHNAASAGAALGVHQQTVANRLRAAEERLGQGSIGARHVELEMALRLRACLARGESSIRN